MLLDIAKPLQYQVFGIYNNDVMFFLNTYTMVHEYTMVSVTLYHKVSFVNIS